MMGLHLCCCSTWACGTGAEAAAEDQLAATGDCAAEQFFSYEDTLFHHVLKNFHGFDEYDFYDPIDYQDWSVP